jgi:tRNA modification GTPase
VVRVSGPSLGPLVTAVCGRLPGPRQVRLVRLRDAAGVFDEGVLTWMPGPRSYTGEDVAEISCHGNPLLVERLLDALCAQGARLASPGEFTRRAFLNGRMDLTRAEAVLQATAATSPAGLRVARAGLEGAVAARTDTLREPLVDLAAELEAVLDYPGEDLLVASDDALAERLQAVATEARTAVAGHRAAQVAVEGARVALVGPVNAGKSSLFNALLGRERALVSPAPGTTRDVVESPLQLDAVRVTLLDTAGERPTDDPVEAAGLALAAEMTAAADLLLVVLPGHLPLDAVGEMLLARTADRPRLLVATHADRGTVLALPAGAGDLHAVAAPTGFGVAALRAALPRALGGEEPGDAATLVASQRQRDLFATVAGHAAAAAAALWDGAGPAVAVERVYEALAALDALVGRDTREVVLDRLFARFCIGK